MTALCNTGEERHYLSFFLRETRKRSPEAVSLGHKPGVRSEEDGSSHHHIASTKTFLALAENPAQLCCSTHKCIFLTIVAPV
ncbi:hypothetical protein AMECASPLE_009891 [Ameca splendens]|uniref:Uncharacterized protein n=1 Tax=Ameca splendens TaxID=208324 RepID=A0ABV0ZWS9_9TELE